MKNPFFLFLFLALSVQGVLGQSELVTPFFDDVFQATYLNPAVRPKHPVSIGLPAISSIYLQVSHNGFVPGKVISHRNDTLRISPDKLLNELSRQNMLFVNADLDLFHLRIKVYNWDYWFGIRQRHSMSLFYPKDLLRLPIEGNADMVGKSFDFGYLGLNAMAFREYTFGAATEVDDWIFGGRLSILQGLSSMYLKPEKLKISVIDDMFQHAFAADAVLYSAGIPFDDDIDGNWITDYMTRFRNPGLALSWGASYRFDHRLNFNFAVTDLGYIRWNDNTRNFSLEGNATFDGHDFLSNLLDDEEIDPDEIIDDFLDNFSDDEFEEDYVTWLHPRFAVTTTYRVADKTQLALQLYTVVNRRLYPAVTVAATQEIGRYLQVAVTASANQKSFSNLGFGLMLKPGPLQIYMMADNYYAPLVDPLSFTNLNFRFGVNFVFGHVKTQQALPYR